MADVLTEVKFWSQVFGDAKRTILCPPDLESRVKGYIAARGMGGVLTVEASPVCPPEQIIVIDEQGMTADFWAAAAQPIRVR